MDLTSGSIENLEKLVKRLREQKGSGKKTLAIIDDLVTELEKQIRILDSRKRDILEKGKNDD